MNAGTPKITYERVEKCRKLVFDLYKDLVSLSIFITGALYAVNTPKKLHLPTAYITPLNITLYTLAFTLTAIACVTTLVGFAKLWRHEPLSLIEALVTLFFLLLSLAIIPTAIAITLA